MVLFNNDYVPPAAIARPEDLEVVYGKQEVVPEFADAFTHDLGGKAMVEDNDAGKSAIVMVYHSQEVRAKGMGCYRLNGPDCTGAWCLCGEPAHSSQQCAGHGTSAYVVISRGRGSCLI